MTDPVLHVLAGPNGAGKTTLFERVIEPVTGLPFVNADRIAAERWPGEEVMHAPDASELAASHRQELLARGSSFATETVFSHSSKVKLLEQATAAGYLVTLHIVLVSVELSVARVSARVRNGGHDVPERKIRQRYERLWTLIVQAAPFAHEVVVYDNSSTARPFRVVAHQLSNRWVGTTALPDWSPTAIFDWTVR